MALTRDHRSAAVVIGRNEGEHLRRSLTSVQQQGLRVVYADSGSTDGSVALARSLGVEVVELDPARRFTAARGRNEGLARLLALIPDLAFVLFVDGDCELVPGFLAAALAALAKDDTVAAVCGRVRERDRERSIYNRLCDMEWEGPTGEVRACGGNAVMRVSCLREVGGYRDDLAGGEEPELCLRLRQRRWKVLRLPVDMVLHDADMTRFSQWWRRAERSGYGHAEGWWLHRDAAERPWQRDNLRVLAWGWLLPVAVLLLLWPTRGLGLLLLAGYPLLATRILLAERRRGRPWRDAGLLAVFLVLCKFPEAVGLARFALRRRRRGVVAPTGGRAQAGTP